MKTTESPPSEQQPQQEGTAGKRRAQLGYILIGCSGLCFAGLLTSPLLPIPGWYRAALAGGFFVAMQVSWWTGVACVGPQVAGKIKSWFSRRDS